MRQVIIRKSGGANIVALPRAVLSALGLHTNSVLEISLDKERIVLTPVQEKLSLESVLAESPKHNLIKTEEDKSWDSEEPQGGEIW